MDMANNAGGFNHKSPAFPPTPNGKVSIFVIEEKTLLKQANVFKVTCPQQNSSTAPRTDLSRFVILTLIDFLQTALMTTP